MSNTDAPEQAPDDGVLHQKTEISIANWDKIVEHAGPHAKEAVAAWRSTEVDKVRLAEAGATERTKYLALSGFAVLACVVLSVVYLACASIEAGRADIAEKIVIGLLAFVGGYGARQAK